MALMKMKGLDKLTKKFKRLEQQFPPLRQNTLNSMAFDVRKNAINNIKKEFTLRNSWTLRSIRVDRATFKRDSVAEVGSILDYMAEQEFGKSVKISNIPTDYVRPSKARNKPVQRKLRLDRLGRFKKITGRDKAIEAIKQAAHAKSKAPLRLDFDGKDAAYIVENFGTYSKIRMIYDFSKDSANLKPEPWLEPALKKIDGKGRRFFARELNKFLRKQ